MNNNRYSQSNFFDGNDQNGLAYLGQHYSTSLPNFNRRNGMTPNKSNPNFRTLRGNYENENKRDYSPVFPPEKIKQKEEGCMPFMNISIFSKLGNFFFPKKNQQNNYNNPAFQIRSPFIKEGNIREISLNDPNLQDDFYNFHNFEFSKYTNKIGEGAFGKVYRARHKFQTNITCAIKVVDKTYMDKYGEEEQNIAKEIATQMSFRHPNIVQMYSFYNTNNEIFMIMEDMVGGNLFDKIQKANYFSEKRAFKYFIQVANAVLFLHENMYVHRDIKPENLLLDSKGNLKLCDFGWCVKLGKDEKRKTFCGTYEYMAPEIIKQEAYNKGIDIWALGVLLYEMLHGYSPFHDETVDATTEEDYTPVFKKILRVDYKIESNRRLSPECIDMIQSCLMTDASKRITIKEIFNHPWVKKFEGINLDDISNVSKDKSRPKNRRYPYEAYSQSNYRKSDKSNISYTQSNIIKNNNNAYLNNLNKNDYRVEYSDPYNMQTGCVKNEIGRQVLPLENDFNNRNQIVYRQTNLPQFPNGPNNQNQNYNMPYSPNYNNYYPNNNNLRYNNDNRVNRFATNPNDFNNNYNNYNNYNYNNNYNNNYNYNYNYNYNNYHNFEPYCNRMSQNSKNTPNYAPISSRLPNNNVVPYNNYISCNGQNYNHRK